MSEQRAVHFTFSLKLSKRMPLPDCARYGRVISKPGAKHPKEECIADGIALDKENMSVLGGLIPLRPEAFRCGWTDPPAKMPASR